MDYTRDRPEGCPQHVWEFVQTEWWKTATPKEITGLILYDQRMLCPFSVFHEAIEQTLGRPVWTHEIGINWDGLIAEYEGGGAPTLAEIMELIPEAKRVVVVPLNKTRP